MTERCPIAFDETLLSGYLDGELTQGRAQKVQVHLEDCAHCRAVYAELKNLREVTMSTRFAEPTDEQWDERPRGTASLSTRGLGWLMAVIWFVTLAGYALWQVWKMPQNLLERLLTFGGLTAFALIFISVVIDRVHAARSDRYQEVEK